MISFFRYRFLGLMKCHTNFWLHPHKNHRSKLSLPWICSSKKNQLILSVHSWHVVNFRVLSPDWPHAFLTMPTQKSLNQLLIFVNLYQHAKNQAISSIWFGDIVNLKILQSDWLRAPWLISQEQDCSQIWDVSGNTTNNINFIKEQIQSKLMTMCW